MDARITIRMAVLHSIADQVLEQLQERSLAGQNGRERIPRDMRVRVANCGLEILKGAVQDSVAVGPQRVRSVTSLTCQ